MTKKKRTPYIMVMVRNKLIPDREWGMEIAFSVDSHGIEQAMREAQEFVDARSRLFTQCEFKMEGGEW